MPADHTYLANTTTGQWSFSDCSHSHTLDSDDWIPVSHFAPLDMEVLQERAQQVRLAQPDAQKFTSACLRGESQRFSISWHRSVYSKGRVVHLYNMELCGEPVPHDMLENFL